VIDKQKTITMPGQHGTRRSKPTEYAKRMREKQKTRRIIGVLERQFRRYFRQASRVKGNTGETLLRLLETRLDNVVRRLGFASSLAAARQMVTHKRVGVNNRIVNIPSYQLKPGDRVHLTDSAKGNLWVRRSLGQALQKGLPSWLEMEGNISAELLKTETEANPLQNVPVAGKVKMWPARQEMSFPVNEQFIVELYSK